MHTHRRPTTPNILSSLRIGAAPFMLLAAWLDRPVTFLALFAFSILTDCLDGYLARRLHQVTRLGATLDSWGDCAVLITLPFGAFRIWPETVRAELPFIVIGMVSYLVPTLLGILKYGLPPNYHTWGAKLSTVMLSLSLLTLFTIGNPWLLRLSTPIFVLEAIEETVMTILLPIRAGDVPSLWHALRRRRQAAARRPQ